MSSNKIKKFELNGKKIEAGKLWINNLIKLPKWNYIRECVSYNENKDYESGERLIKIVIQKSLEKFSQKITNITIYLADGIITIPINILEDDIMKEGTSYNINIDEENSIINVIMKDDFITELTGIHKFEFETYYGLKINMIKENL